MFVCTLALVIRHLKHIFSAQPYVIACGRSGCLVLVHISDKRHDTWKTTNIFVLIFSFQKEFSDIPQMTVGPHVKYPTFLSDFNESNNPQINNVMKIRPMGAELLYVEGQADRQTYRHTRRG